MFNHLVDKKLSAWRIYVLLAAKKKLSTCIEMLLA